MLKLGAMLQRGGEEVSNEAMETMDLEHAFGKCVRSKGQKSRAASGIS